MAGLIQPDLPGEHNFDVVQGATLRRVVTWLPGGIPADLTGCTASLQARDTDDNSVVLTLTSPVGIVMGGVLGTLTLTASPTDTGAIVVGDYRYDIRIVDTLSQVIYLLFGVLSVKPRQTLS